MDNRKENNSALICEVIDNLKNLDDMMAYLEQKEDAGSIFSLIRSNLHSDMEKLALTINKTN